MQAGREVENVPTGNDEKQEWRKEAEEEEEQPSQRRNASIGKAKAKTGFGVEDEKPLPKVELFVFLLQQNLASPSMEWDGNWDEGGRRVIMAGGGEGSFIL